MSKIVVLSTFALDWILLFRIGLVRLALLCLPARLGTDTNEQDLKRKNILQPDSSRFCLHQLILLSAPSPRFFWIPDFWLISPLILFNWIYLRIFAKEGRNFKWITRFRRRMAPVCHWVSSQVKVIASRKSVFHNIWYFHNVKCILLSYQQFLISVKFSKTSVITHTYWNHWKWTPILKDFVIIVRCPWQ